METVDTPQPDTTQQVTSKMPATKQKNPKRVAAGKAIAERTRQAREAQKTALAEANVIIANNQLKPAAIAAPAEPPAAEPPAAEPPAAEPESTKITQWLSVIGIFVSLLGIYYKREEIKGLLARPQVPPPVPPNSPVLPTKGINLMD